MTKAKLFEATERSIEYISKSIDGVRNLLKKLDSIDQFMKARNIDSSNESFYEMEKMLEYRMLIGIIYLDLASSTRAHLNSKYTYEKLFSMRQIIVIINEGYKQIYHFVHLNDKGDPKTKYRNKSFWYKDIGHVVKESYPELTTEYDVVTKKLDDYFDNNFSSIKKQRDLSVHYDKKASKVYDMVISINIDETFKKMLPFLQILNDMFRFTEKMVLAGQEKAKKKNIEQNKQIESMLLDMETKIESTKTKENANEIN